MLSSELTALITSDPQAAALFARGDDTGCAERCTAIAPRIRASTPCLFGQLGILKVFAAAGSEFGGDAFLTALEELANAGQPFSGTVRRVLASIYPPCDGADFADPVIMAQLEGFVAANLLDAGAVAIMKNAVQVPQTITADEVSLTRNRT